LVAGDRIIVRLVKAEKESATIQVQGIDESAVKTEISDNVLEISIFGEPFTKKKVIVTLHYVQLSDITVTGGADVTTTSLMKMEQLNINLKSGGMLYLDADIQLLSGKLSEGAILNAEGYAETLDMVVTSTATLSAYDLECEKVTLKANAGGKAKINVETELDVEVTSRGFVSYKGTPAKLNRTVTSGGTLSVYEP
jgi:Putative auto-transporter adhesin, head GIN domain